MSAATIRNAYRKQAGLRDDPGQREVVDRLHELQQALIGATLPLARLRRALPFLESPAAVKGLYLWGGVGRGKTMLMDLFFDTLPLRDKKRIHFHRMMAEVHERLKRIRGSEDPLDPVAADIASEARLLCFDEFFVSDIGDAMILGRLLDGLFRRGVTLVATSNTPPAELYAGGLQRDRFLPAVALLERHTAVVELDGGVDYRLELLRKAGTYLTPSDRDAHARLHTFFTNVAPGGIVESRRLDINGRPIDTLRAAKGVAWFDFEALCEGPRSQRDYIEIARWYQTVIVSDVPVLTTRRDNAARRFIALVDEFYDRRVKLIVSAADTADTLYRGRRLATEFQRTVSRLVEMQSTSYLHAAHRA